VRLPPLHYVAPYYIARLVTSDTRTPHIKRAPWSKTFSCPLALGIKKFKKKKKKEKTIGRRGKQMAQLHHLLSLRHCPPPSTTKHLHYMWALRAPLLSRPWTRGDWISRLRWRFLLRSSFAAPRDQVLFSSCLSLLICHSLRLAHFNKPSGRQFIFYSTNSCGS
jgi:hypothetical protein